VKASKQEGNALTDLEIIELYQNRSESAISETQKQYGSYCLAIAMNILHSKEDSEEVVNDTLLNAWNAIPPKRPIPFSTYLGRITRNLLLDKYKAKKSQKRGGDEITLMLSELEGCIPTSQSVEEAVDGNILEEAINSFLLSIKKEDRIFFMNRYWYGESIAEIAEQFNVKEGKVIMNLLRTRNKLKNELEKRGVTV
jgi:RNA polymerase sigma-70 factor (ECF subfamily)